MLKYFCIRCLTALVVILGVASLVFMLIHIVPGDPVEVMLGESAQPGYQCQVYDLLRRWGACPVYGGSEE